MEQNNGETSFSGSHVEATSRTETMPLQGGSSETRGLRIITICLTVFTALISIALGLQIYYGDNKVHEAGSVVSNDDECTAIGADVLTFGGNAVDAAVAVTLCMGVVQPHLTGVGGGGFMVVYDHKHGEPINCYDFRPSKSGNSFAGVPGFLAGLAAAHEAHGKLSWAEVVRPAALVARGGFKVGGSLLSTTGSITPSSPVNLREWLKTLKAGSITSSPELANLLDQVASEGAQALYNGTLSENLAKVLNRSDLAEYSVGVSNCEVNVMLGHKFIVPGQGSGGPMFLDTIRQHVPSLLPQLPLAELLTDIGRHVELSWHLTAGVNVAVVDGDDLYVSTVTGLGSVLGSQRLLPDGYILNNAVDLWIPVGSDHNKPVSLAVPFVIVEEGQICGRRYVGGGSDVRDVLQLVYQILFNGEPVPQAVEAPRARILGSKVLLEDHHVPNFAPFQQVDIQRFNVSLGTAPIPYPSLNLILKESDTLTFHVDSRGDVGV